MLSIKFDGKNDEYAGLHITWQARAPSATLKYCYNQPAKFDHHDVKLKLESSLSKVKIWKFQMLFSNKQKYSEN